jgi:hypothetical protein
VTKQSPAMSRSSREDVALRRYRCGMFPLVDAGTAGKIGYVSRPVDWATRSMLIRHWQRMKGLLRYHRMLHKFCLRYDIRVCGGRRPGRVGVLRPTDTACGLDERAQLTHAYSKILTREDRHTHRHRLRSTMSLLAR